MIVKQGLFLVITLVLTTSCVSSTHVYDATGAFNDDVEKFKEEFSKIVIGETSAKALEESGWRLNGENTRTLQGKLALEAMLPANAFQGLFDSLEKLKNIPEALKEISAYKLVKIPCVLLEETTRYVWGSTSKKPKGHKIYVEVGFKNNLVIYLSVYIETLNKPRLKKAFGQGFVDWLSDYSKPLRNIKIVESMIP